MVACVFRPFLSQPHPVVYYPLERTECPGVFAVVGVDFASPIKYRKSLQVERKA